MKTSGWIKLHRKMANDPLWLSEPFTKAQAWVDLLFLANHAPGQIRRRGVVVHLERGMVGWSERELAERWKWSRGKLIRFLKELIKMDRVTWQISAQTVPKKTSVSACIYINNYDLYQGNGTEESIDGTEESLKTVPKTVPKKTSISGCNVSDNKNRTMPIIAKTVPKNHEKRYQNKNELLRKQLASKGRS